MTSLKLRAYSHSERRYINYRTIILNTSGSPIAITTGGMFAKRIPIKDVTLERYTGRKDRNGTPVFENDVIQRYIEPTTGYYYPGRREVVEWKETGTCTGWGMTARTEHRIEVVGTAHEVAA